ncbi:acyl-CoA N-acyltransferase [Kockovaella imperatae]|uniref:Acyl-CoA N-acyltransferase n=1 Tax=Kockovaella imperatae TaxID=4999 RepID=A0A1Y1U934_9TREE|nr:acyl-CoA N-acyltransferase [Kockovaella imperatae]ORX34540.1 acyl-CoA N-acyltransferase [Kockovaella imperatae]
MSKSDRPRFNIKVAETKDEIEACYDIRIEVFVVEQGFPLDVEIDDYDKTATHLLLTTPVSSPPPESTASLTPSLEPSSASTSQKPIGTIRWNPSVGKVARLVVAKEYRKYGFGRVLMDELHQHVKSTSVDKRSELKTAKEVNGKEHVHLWLNAQMYAIPFYVKMGYEQVGEEFDEDGAPHVKMVRDLELI